MKKYLPVITLTLVSIFLCFQNYTPGTFLSGWDTLHPEFNFGLAIKREFFGVFRTYQGLGAVAAHSDMADLPRIILLYLVSPFIPMSFLRYFYIFLTLILGPIGMYCFLRYILVIPNQAPLSGTKPRNPMKDTEIEGISRYARDDRGKIPSFLGAFFYLLNLGAMQQFIVPFEMFTTQYAALPWLFLFATDYLSCSRKSEYQNPSFDSRSGRPELVERAKSETISKFKFSNVQNRVRRDQNFFDFVFWSFGFVSNFVLRIWNLCTGIPKQVRDDRTVLLLFAITTILATPMAYAATLWYVYFIAFILYVGSLSLLLSLRESASWRRRSNLMHLEIATPVRGLVRNDKKGETTTSQTGSSLARKAFILILLTLLINSFWILPNIYYILNHGQEVTQANINKLFSPQAFLYNKEFGNIKDISFLKTFLFDWSMYAGKDQFTQLLSPWIAHLRDPFVQVSGYLFATIALLGIVFSILKKNKILLSLMPLLFLCLFFLFNDNFPTSPLYNFLGDKIPFFKEVFRFPQNKVLGIFTFVFAIYFAAGQSLLTTAYKRIKYGQIIIFSILLIYFMLPAFKGNFINPYMRIKIPQVYFDLFKWFDKEPQDGRIANLPIHSLWGWEYYDWSGLSPSFQGAGFLWFGIKQPILARDFDRWDPHNEQYYREMSYAIYSQNPEALKLVIEKYNIKYIIFDKSIIAPQNNSKVLLHQETQTLLNQQDYIEKVKQFGNNLIVYKVKPKPSSTWSKTPYEEYYPFRNLTDNQNKVLPNIIKFTQEGVVIKLPKNTRNLTLPSYLDAEESIPSDLVVEKNQNQLTITLYPRLPTLDTKDRPTPITIKAPIPESENIILSINKKDNFIFNPATIDAPLSLGKVSLSTKSKNIIVIYPSTPNETITPDLSTIKYYIEPCQDIADQRGYSTAPSFGIEKANANSFNIFAKNTHLCMTMPLSNVLQKDLKYSEVLLNVTFNYKSNLPLKFCIARLINSACQNYSDNRLNQYFGIQSQDIQDLGLKFQFDTTFNNNIEKAYYNYLTLSLTYPFSVNSLSSDMLKKSFESIDHNLLKSSTIILPFSSNKELSRDVTKLPKTNGFCPNAPFSDPKLIKKQILGKNNDYFIRYESINGLSCDHFSYQNLSQDEAYLIAITSRNVKGLPSTLCVTNAVSRHCDIYTTFSPNKDFSTDIFLLPPLIKNENGFDINIGNLGIKKSPSINDLKSIEIIPIPYKWLTQIRHSGDERSEDSRISNVLVFPQSFEKGWRAYRVQSSIHSTSSGQEFKVQSWINRTFPFFFGEELKDHVLVNGWANGWVLDNSAIKQPARQSYAQAIAGGFNNGTIVILFLPQYLEYLGFLLLLGTFAWLMKK